MSRVTRGTESQSQPPNMNPNSGSNQLDFSQAMTDFKIMFPNMEVEVIETVLRSNNGAVDVTIDQLLAMTADIEEKSNCSDNNLPTYKEAVDNIGRVQNMFGATSLRDTGQGPDLLSGLDSLDTLGAAGGSSSASVSLRSIKNWNPPLLGKLPPDFLRIKPPQSSRQGHSYTHPERFHSGTRPRASEAAGSRSHDHGHPARGEPSSDRNQQLLEDEKFAMMLQNEEFMRELRGNQEFMSALADDHDCDMIGQESQHQQTYEKPKDASSRRPHLGMDDAVFREKLKNMGKTSKQKFAKLATMFSRQRSGVGRVLGQSLGHAPAPSKDNLLLNADPVAHSRLEDSDSEDDTHCTTKGRKYQLM